MTQKKLRVGIIDVVAKEPERTLYARVMNANLASIMPQVSAVWARRAGHEVTYVCYTGLENLVDELPKDVDIVFISAFTEAAQLAYCISNLFRSRGAVTALGGPHARCYPQDAQKYFDYVFGFTDEETLRDVLAECAPSRPIGRRVAAPVQPIYLPGIRERWPFIKATLRKAPFIKMVPMLGSLGCPYTCSFCIDATVRYQPLDFSGIKEDLGFLARKMKKPLVGWHDPNFGVRFDDYMTVLEEAAPAGALGHVAESSLSMLSEPRLKRMQRVGFRAMLPGIESKPFSRPSMTCMAAPMIITTISTAARNTVTFVRLAHSARRRAVASDRNCPSLKRRKMRRRRSARMTSSDSEPGMNRLR